ncbi:hypothetical protein EVAR_73056_1 [Eumeta japonica]|uniref:Uncharacterized protein n=1 Tax=Eumeta variegata TaxID=151549 RepID=A0A4C1TCH7_EUMVA|nr:hypothetical protein EVAR_73056_1 [Eumeta japonica]
MECVFPEKASILVKCYTCVLRSRGEMSGLVTAAKVPMRLRLGGLRWSDFVVPNRISVTWQTCAFRVTNKFQVLLPINRLLCSVTEGLIPASL